MVLLRIINPRGWAGINCRTDCKQFTTLIAAEMREPSWENLSDDGREGKRYLYLSFSYLASSLLWSADLNLRFTAQLIPQGELHFLLRRGKERDLWTARFPKSRRNLATGQRRGECKERKEIRERIDSRGCWGKRPTRRWQIISIELRDTRRLRDGIIDDR